MASITTSEDGLRRLQFSDASGTRRTVALGRMPVKQAETVKRNVEAVVAAQVANCSIPLETARWLEGLDDRLRGKLANCGLIERRDSVTLAVFLDEYISGRKDVKESSRDVWARAKTHLLTCFDGNRPLRSFTVSDAKDFRQYMLGRGMAEATVRRMSGFAKQFFSDAQERELVSTNAFRHKSVPTTGGRDESRKSYITRESIDRVIDAAPNAEWRLILALSRFAGLRCPSEHLELRWSDVNWHSSRMVVRSKKTERHEGKASRIVPIFPELRPYLEEAFEVYGERSEFVVPSYRGTSESKSASNLRNHLLKFFDLLHSVRPFNVFLLRILL